ncbi:MAG TPA: GrpB family protein [Pyrinomonadaceae bacterium]|nr:GrpB family protein [Pyrinomonadaceae bacterium]
MLGLRRGTVRLVPYMTEWARLFASERQRLVVALGGLALAVEHVGSTAVPGLCAKPILDIGVAVRDDADAAACVGPLAGLGYEYLGARRGAGGHFFAKGADERRTHYVHVVAQAEPEWAAYLRFRDHLRADTTARDEYARLKQDLAATHAADRACYTHQKAAFIQRILADTTAHE